MEGLLKTQMLHPKPRVSEAVGSGVGPQNLPSNKFPGDAEAACPGTTLSDEKGQSKLKGNDREETLKGPS